MESKKMPIENKPQKRTREEVVTFISETSKYRHLTTQYCVGNGIDIGSGGDAVVPWAISMDLPEEEYNHYNSNQKPRGPIHYRATDLLFNLPFKSNTLSFLYASHIAEDVPEEKWPEMFREWARVLIPGGNMIILVPERNKWNYAVKVLGQIPNCQHRHEPVLGELTKMFTLVGLQTICDKLTNCHPNDYTILGVAKKPGSPNSIGRREWVK